MAEHRLTDERIRELFDYKQGFTTWETYSQFARAIEAELAPVAAESGWLPIEKKEGL